MIWLNPYFWGACLLGIALSVFGGCRWQASNDSAQLERVRTDMVICAADKNTLADALNQVNAKAEQAKRDAAAQAANAVQAIRQADKDRATYEAKLGSVESALERAKRQPICRAQLESPLCTDLD